jgi:hypothetical protein
MQGMFEKAAEVLTGMDDGPACHGCWTFSW